MTHGNGASGRLCCCRRPPVTPPGDGMARGGGTSRRPPLAPPGDDTACGGRLCCSAMVPLLPSASLFLLQPWRRPGVVRSSQCAARCEDNGGGTRIFNAGWGWRGGCAELDGEESRASREKARGRECGGWSGRGFKLGFSPHTVKQTKGRDLLGGAIGRLKSANRCGEATG